MQAIKRPVTHHGASSKSLLTQNTNTTNNSANPSKAPNLMREGISVQHQVTILSKEAKSLMDAGKFTEAIECLNVAIQMNNSHVSLINRAHCKKHLKNFEGAIEDFTLALRLDPANVTCFNQRGICYSKLEKYEHAIRDLNSAYDIEPSLQLAFNRANIYSEARDFHAGIREFSRIIDADPGDLKFRCMYQRANIYIEVEDFASAIHDLRLVLTQDPNSFAPRVLLGKAYMGLNDFEKAEESFTHAVLIDSKKTDVYVERGNARCRIGKKEKIMLAVEDYSTAIRIINERKTQRKMSAVMYANTVVHLLHQEEKKADISTSMKSLLGKQDTRKSSIKDNDAPPELTPYILKINKSLAALHHKRCLARLIVNPTSNSILQDALHDALEARDYQSNNAEYQILVAKCYIRLGRYDEAIDALQKIVNAKPDSFPALYQLAFVHRINNNILEAVDCLTKIIAHHKDESDTGSDSFILRVFELRGTLLYEQSAYKYALSDFGRAVNICPDRPENYYFRAQCHAKLGDFEQALYDYEMAEERRFEDKCNLLLSKGMVARIMRDYDYAVESFSSAMVALENVPDPNIRLKYRLVMFRSLCFIDQERYNVAYLDLYALRKVMESDADERDSSLLWILYFHIALTLHMQGHYYDASEYLLQCIGVLASSAPDSAAAGAALYFYCVDIGILAEEEKQVTVDYIEHISKCMDTAWAATPRCEMLCYFVRGKAYQRQHRHMEAIADFNHAIDLQQDDDSAYIHFRRGWSHKAMKQFDLAGIDFETAKRLRPNDPNFSIDYKNVNNIDYIVVRTEPDTVEPFMPILEAVKGV